MSDINTPEPAVAPEVAPTPEPVLPIGLAETAAVDEAARASESANAAHVQVVVDSTHRIGTSLLHHTTTYVEHVERGVTRIEQIIGR